MTNTNIERQKAVGNMDVTEQSWKIRGHLARWPSEWLFCHSLTKGRSRGAAMHFHLGILWCTSFLLREGIHVVCCRCVPKPRLLESQSKSVCDFSEIIYLYLTGRTAEWECCSFKTWWMIDRNLLCLTTSFSSIFKSRFQSKLLAWGVHWDSADLMFHRKYCSRNKSTETHTSLQAPFETNALLGHRSEAVHCCPRDVRNKKLLHRANTNRTSVQF